MPQKQVTDCYARPPPYSQLSNTYQNTTYLIYLHPFMFLKVILIYVTFKNEIATTCVLIAWLKNESTHEFSRYPCTHFPSSSPFAPA